LGAVSAPWEDKRASGYTDYLGVDRFDSGRGLSGLVEEVPDILAIDRTLFIRIGSFQRG
jgi:hypothetical protein